MRETNKYFLWLTAEIVLLSLLGFFTNLLSAHINLDLSFVWGALIITMLFLVVTTWFKAQRETESVPLHWPSVPDTISFTLSTHSIVQGLRAIVGLIINAIFFGWFAANASLFSTRTLPWLEKTGDLAYPVTSQLGIWLWGRSIWAYPFEVVGVFMLGWVSAVVWKRISTKAGIMFCLVSTISFSLTHIMLFTYQPISVTVIGNVLSALGLTVAALFLSPVLNWIVHVITGFWAQLWEHA